ncbi:MAG TPA: alpha/beta hydrolase [Rhizomicrobium sp.]|nr:alpha/beta hydrolase [Rhizomicrobium sp.]
MRKFLIANLLTIALAVPSLAQAPLPPVPAPQAVPKPGPVTKGPYVPQALLPGGIVMPLFPPDSPYLNAKRVSEAEVYDMDPVVPGRVARITNIHNPSIEVHLAGGGNNTGTAIILVPGGGHRTLGVGSEGADPVSYFFQYGINTVILRNRLRSSGYEPKTDAVYDIQQAIRLVRAHASEWHIDPKKIGIMGFSAGAELTMAAAIQYPQFNAKNNAATDPLAGFSARPDFVGSIYPGPSLFTPAWTAKNGTPPIPKDAPPSFIAGAGWQDQKHAVWADEYFSAMLHAGIPNVEIHIYARGQHGGGLGYRDFTGEGAWQDRFVHWLRDLGFFAKPGVETLAAQDVAAFVKQPAAATP